MRTTPSTGTRLTKPLICSAIIHLVIFTALLVVPGIYVPFRDRPMKIDMVWVELPKGTSEEIDGGIKQAQTLPQSTIEEQKKQFQPEPVPQQKTLSPELKAPPEKPPEPKTAEKPKTPDKPKPDMANKMIKTDPNAKKLPKTGARESKKIRNALAKIDKELSGRQITPEAAQVEKSGEGYKYGTGDKPVLVSRSDPEFLKYQAMVRTKVMREWIAPVTHSEEGKRYNARLDILINMDGEVISTRWIKASGNKSFDESAKRAVRSASPFPKPPDRIAWEAYNEGFLIEFSP